MFKSKAVVWLRNAFRSLNPTKASGNMADNDPGHPYARTKHISFIFHRQVNSPGPVNFKYFVSLPPAYSENPTKKWPLVLFLHGGGESQIQDNESYASFRHGVPKIILCYDRWKQGLEPSIDIPRPPRKGVAPGDRSSEPVKLEVCEIVADNFITVTPSLVFKHGIGWDVNILDALLDEIIEKHNVDTSRIHLTGLSMGGFGTFALGIHNPSRFASLVPLCAACEVPIEDKVDRIKDIPIWIFHGENDRVVPAAHSRKIVEALKTTGSKNVRMTVIDGVGHDCWTEAYNDVGLWEWMLKHRRNSDS